jgi:L-threonylcarbamoyladenylate synthase
MMILSSLSDPRLADLLLSGKVGVIPTDTIYGLAALASNKEGVARVYGLKKRDKKLGTFIAASIEQLLSLDLDEQALRAVAHLWPNPISIAIPTIKTGGYLDLGKGSLAVRIPKHDDLRSILERTGPLVTSSANLFDQPPANTIEEAQAYFFDNVDFYVDAGDLSGRPPSTIAAFLDGHLEVLRQGAVYIDNTGNIKR